MLTSGRERRKDMARKKIIMMKRTEKVSLDDLVTKLVGKCVKALEKKELKVAITDLFRLRELQKELAPKEPIIPKVTWLDSGMEGGRD
jgi:hypothetical protein